MFTQQLYVDPSKYKITRVCEAYELESLTRSGWVVLSILKEEEVVTTTEDEVAQGISNSTPGCYPVNATTFQVRRTFTRDTHRYFIGLDENASHIRLNDEITDLQTRLKATVENGKLLNKENANLTKEVAGHKQQHVYMTDKYQAECKLHEETRALKQKLENDIAKIRIAIGEKTMKDILSPEKK